MLPHSNIFAALPLPMWLYDPESLYFLEVNDAAVRQYGYSEVEFKAMTIKDIRPVEDVPALVKETSSLFEQIHNAGIWRHLRRDGSLVHVEVLSFPVEYDGRSVRAVVAKDITKQVNVKEENRRLAERAYELRRRAEDASVLLRVASRVARLGGWFVEKGNDRVLWTDETAAIHEMPAGTHPTVEDGIGFYAPEYRGRIAEVFGRAMEYGDPYDEVLQILTAGGKRIWVRAIGEPEFNDSGQITAVRGAFQDIDQFVSTQEENQRLREALDNISDAFFTLDSEWRFTFVNAQAERIAGTNRSALIGKKFLEEFPGIRNSRFETEYRQVVATQKPATFIEEYSPLGVLADVSAYPTPEGLAVRFSDVSEQRAQRERLRLLENAVAHLNDIVIITEAEPFDYPGPRIVFVNEAFTKHTGFAAEEAIGQSPRILQGPETQRESLDKIRDALERKAPVRTEVINYTRSGEPFWLELDIVPIDDETGRFTHFVSVQRDITVRKKLEAALAENEERFRLIAKATSDVVWDWNVETGETWWNEGMQMHFGYSLDTNQSFEFWADNIHTDDRERILAAVREFLDSQETYWEAEYRFLKANGETTYIKATAFAIRDANGKAIRMLGSMSDVTDERKLDEHLAEAQKLEAIGQLTGGIAHDFNNLLTVILGNAEDLAEELSGNEDLRTLAEMSARAALRGAELTDRLLAFSRRQALEPRKLDVNELLNSLRGLFRRTLAEDIDIAYYLSDEALCAFADEGQLEAALLNLAINARDAMPEGGCLTFETTEVVLDENYAARHQEVSPGSYVKISISDSGTGMPPEVAEKVFEPFFTTKEVGKGSGLGLSMVFGFVKQSRGHIKIYSEVGEGTTINLYLPVFSEAVDVEALNIPYETVVGGSETVLLVEDDQMVREHTRTQLRSHGYKVLHAADGWEALEQLKERSDIDLLLTDVVMPRGLNGAELARKAQKLCPGLKVLFTSGYAENAIVHRGRLDPGVLLLHKPYRRKELAAKVRQALDS